MDTIQMIVRQLLYLPWSSSSLIWKNFFRHFPFLPGDRKTKRIIVVSCLIIKRTMLRSYKVSHVPLHSPSLSAFSRISNSWTTCEFNRSLEPGTSSNWSTRFSVARFIQCTSMVEVERFRTVNVREVGSLSFLIRAPKIEGVLFKNRARISHNRLHTLVIWVWILWRGTRNKTDDVFSYPSRNTLQEFLYKKAKPYLVAKIKVVRVGKTTNEWLPFSVVVGIVFQLQFGL